MSAFVHFWHNPPPPLCVDAFCEWPVRHEMCVTVGCRVRELSTGSLLSKATTLPTCRTTPTLLLLADQTSSKSRWEHFLAVKGHLLSTEVENKKKQKQSHNKAVSVTDFACCLGWTNRGFCLHKKVAANWTILFWMNLHSTQIVHTSLASFWCVCLLWLAIFTHVLCKECKVKR